MITKLKQLIDRHAELSALHDSPTCEIPLQTIDKEQDEITDEVFAIVCENLKGLAIVQNTIEKVQSIIECTYGHQQNEDSTDGERDDSEEPSFSSSDIVEFLCEIEGIVDDSVTVLGESITLKPKQKLTSASPRTLVLDRITQRLSTLGNKTRGKHSSDDEKLRAAHGARELTKLRDWILTKTE